MPMNDNDFAPPLSPDPHGPAALLLVESLLHGLCEKAALTSPEAVEIVDRAASVQSDRAEAADDGAPAMWQSHALLASIGASLRHDVAAAAAPPRAVT